MEEENIKSKKTMFDRFLNFVSKLKERKNDNTIIKSYSKFEDFLLEVDPDSEVYDIIKKVISLCDNAIDIAHQRIFITQKIQILNDELEDVKCYQNLSEEDTEELKKMLSRFISLSKDKTALRHKIISYDKGLINMEDFRKDAKLVLNSLEDAERHQRILKHDINYLDGENSELKYQREMLLTGRSLLNKFSVFMVTIFSISSIVLVFFAMFKKLSIFIPVTFMCILFILIITTVYLLNDKIKKELIINAKKQKKAILLLNKKNVVYAYYTNFVDFVYNKYNINSSEKLKQNIKDYSNYKQLTTRFDAIKGNLYKTENDIELFLKKNNITNFAITTEKFAKTINIEDKRNYYKELEKELNRLELRLKQLDEKHLSIWNELSILNNFDKTEDKVIDKIIQRYLEEVSHIANINFNFENEEELENLNKEIDKILNNIDSVNIDNTDNMNYNMSK